MSFSPSKSLINLKRYPRSWIDLKNSEVGLALIGLTRLGRMPAKDKAQQFESSFAKFIQTKAATSFPSCRSATFYALKALSLAPGDEIVLPAYTFWVDAAMVKLAGLTPVFVDVELKSHNIDPKKIEEAISSRTKAIFLTHLNGLPASMEPIMKIARKYSLRVIEDCARACGAFYQNKRVGSFDIGLFSFGYGKSLYGFGGGMVTSNDTEFIERLRELKSDFKQMSILNMFTQIAKGVLLKYLNDPYFYRFFLFPRVRQFEVHGNTKYNSWFKIQKAMYKSVPPVFKTHLSATQSSVAKTQLSRIDESNDKRLANARVLNEALKGIDGIQTPIIPAESKHVFVHYGLWVENKRELQLYLIDNNIDVQEDSADDTTKLEAFRELTAGKHFPITERLDKRVVFLPTHPCLGRSDMLFIAEKVKRFYE